MAGRLRRAGLECAGPAPVAPPRCTASYGLVPDRADDPASYARRLAWPGWAPVRLPASPSARRLSCRGDAVAVGSPAVSCTRSRAGLQLDLVRLIYRSTEAVDHVPVAQITTERCV